ncbi:MAG TPA: NAD(P)-dependent oxidoreductase [Anaerolineae bacterium]|nr:NAD(P)-dependent oxidoreductase [Anaerolineae bacterium]HQI87575.1 NAD(P)-dependent oxidoreductase [Anaerolineae bacterium]
MNILITGGYGNIGVMVVRESLQRGHAVTVFEVRNKATEKKARAYEKRGVTTRFGDIRNLDDVKKAMAGQDAVIHMAAILPPVSDQRPELCHQVNVEGTQNIVEAIQGMDAQPALVFVSSASVMGPTQDQPPPVKADTPLNPTDAYSSSKAAAETIVRASNTTFCVLRLAAVMPTILILNSMIRMLKVIYDMPLDARCEIVLDEDVAFALVSAAENLAGTGELRGQTGFIAGGHQNGLQINIAAMLKGSFNPLGIELPDARLFSDDLNSYYLDWYDTEAIQSILHYQNHNYNQWQAITKRNYRYLRPLVTLARPFVQKWLERQSPRY